MKAIRILSVLALVPMLAGLVLGTACTCGTYQVQYKVTGSADSASLTYVNRDGGTSQKSNVSLPWTYSFRAAMGAFVYISAQNNGETGSVTTTIYKEGKEFKSSTSTGPYVIATASGRIS